MQGDRIDAGGNVVEQLWAFKMVELVLSVGTGARKQTGSRCATVKDVQVGGIVGTFGLVDD